jgi:putative flippase GtrA
MVNVWTVLGKCPVPMKFTLVSVLGFATDAVVLHLLMEASISPAWARLVSLFCAMQVTFLINGLVVFKRLDLARPWRQWATYMAAHGFGNLCNYLIFITLVSLHRPPVSAPLVALAIASVSAWAINYFAARYLVFRKAKVIEDCVTPQPARPHGGRGPV